ncbi:MarR family winged helix-turn-helix transcriptional regulator [Paucimonas lemoignei]|uniref:MarR family winged helix-turn-helix transcriptional regulator n=1 Tax=Paucimonas lemoignei TaxID=29443 RepID=UPI001FB3ACEF|nr:MarR family winged helix-turn-helix transcriptional regulator [Paucimonas lemoignei]
MKASTRPKASESETEGLDVDKLADMNDVTKLVAVNDSIRILQSVRRIAQCVEHHSKRLSTTHKITSPQLVALMAIAQLGPSTLKSIGRAIYLSPSTVVGIVDRLEEKKLVRRERDTRDRRNVYVTVTAEGLALIESAPSALPQGFTSALSTLPENDQHTLVIALEQFATLLEVKSPGGTL